MESALANTDVLITVGSTDFKAYAVTITGNSLTTGGTHAALTAPDYAIDLVNVNGAYIFGNLHADFDTAFIKNTGGASAKVANVMIYDNQQYTADNGAYVDFDLTATIGIALHRPSGTGYTEYRGASAGTDIIKARIEDDSNERFRLEADGALFWGDGSGAVDTALYRSAANVLKTDDAFIAAGGVTSTS